MSGSQQKYLDKSNCIENAITQPALTAEIWRNERLTALLGAFDKPLGKVYYDWIAVPKGSMRFIVVVVLKLKWARGIKDNTVLEKVVRDVQDARIF